MAVQDIAFTAPGIGSVIMLPDSTTSQVNGGYGGWDVVSRPKRKGLTQWNGKDPIRMQIPILFDGHRKRNSQEIPISKLSRMALPPEGGKGEPPVITVDGNGIPHPGPERWVIENLVWGTNVIWERDRSGSMSRMRQDCVVNLLEHVAEDRVAFSGLATQPVAPSGRIFLYTVQEGDTLNQIAVQAYSDSTQWNKIAEANDLRDPSALLTGEVLVIP